MTTRQDSDRRKQIRRQDDRDVLTSAMNQLDELIKRVHALSHEKNHLWALNVIKENMK